MTSRWLPCGLPGWMSTVGWAVWSSAAVKVAMPVFRSPLLVVKAQRSDDRIRRIRSPRAPWMCNREASRLCSYAEAEAHLRGDVLRRGWWDAALSCLTIGRWAGRTAGRRMYSCPPL